MPLTLARVILNIRDRDKQLAFWHDVMGLPIKGDDSDPNVIELDTGNGTTLLLLKGGKLADFEYAPRLVLLHDDPADLHEQLTLSGLKVGKLKEFGPHLSFDATDPEGNPFQISNRP